MRQADNKAIILGVDNVSAVVDVLCQSFFDYPVMRWVVDRDFKGYEKRLRTLIHFFVMARVMRKELLVGIGNGTNLDGAALVSRPTGEKSPPELAALREKVWDELGRSARAKYEKFGATCHPFEVKFGHLHLNMIGVRGQARGQGVGRTLLNCVHRLSEDDPESEGVTLTTEDPANLPLYEHLGYKVVGHGTVVPGLETWTFFRPDHSGHPR